MTACGRVGFETVPSDECSEWIIDAELRWWDTANHSHATNYRGKACAARERIRCSCGHADNYELLHLERARRVGDIIGPADERAIWREVRQTEPGPFEAHKPKPELDRCSFTSKSQESRARTAMQRDDWSAARFAPLGEAHSPTIADLHRSLAPRTTFSVHRTGRL